MSSARILVVGAGVFGLAAALEARRRGHEVAVFDSGEIPNPRAASTDISKVVRMEYGPDETYMALAEEAREGWLAWNESWRRAGRPALYHETGVLMMSLETMAPGGFEHESFRLLSARGHRPERIGGAALVERFPAWRDEFADGFFHARGGFAESGRVVAALAEDAGRQGIRVRAETPVQALVEEGDRVVGVRGADGSRHVGDHVIVAAGSWTGRLLGELDGALRRTYHPVWHLRPKNPELFTATRFPTFTADVARTGFYGFPLHPEAAVVKIGNHGVGLAAPEDGSLSVPEEATARLRAFLARYFPSLAGAEIGTTRLCPYCDTADEDFWIARDPRRQGLTVASGGSGHGFKFAPILGRVIADIAGITDTADADQVPGVTRSTDTATPLAEALTQKFRWRPELRLERGLEAARCHESVF